MTDIDMPFPVEGTVEATDYGSSVSLPCSEAWLTETPHGDYLQQAVDRVARQYGEGVEVRVRFTADRMNLCCGGYELLGPVENDDDGDGGETDA